MFLHHHDVAENGRHIGRWIIYANYTGLSRRGLGQLGRLMENLHKFFMHRLILVENKKVHFGLHYLTKLNQFDSLYNIYDTHMYDDMTFKSVQFCKFHWWIWCKLLEAKMHLLYKKKNQHNLVTQDCKIVWVFKFGLMDLYIKFNYKNGPDVSRSRAWLIL